MNSMTKKVAIENFEKILEKNFWKSSTFYNFGYPP